MLYCCTEALQHRLVAYYCILLVIYQVYIMWWCISVMFSSAPGVFFLSTPRRRVLQYHPLSVPSWLQQLCRWSHPTTHKKVDSIHGDIYCETILFYDVFPLWFRRFRAYFLVNTSETKKSIVLPHFLGSLQHNNNCRWSHLKSQKSTQFCHCKTGLFYGVPDISVLFSSVPGVFFPAHASHTL